MEISLRVVMAAIVILIVIIIVISLMTKFGSGAGGQMEGLFKWISDILGGGPK